MAAKEFPLSVVIRALDRVTAPMRTIQSAIARFDDRTRARFRNFGNRLGLPAMTEGASRLGSALGDLGRRASIVAGALGGIGAAAVGLGFLAARSLIDTASEFERFRTILSTIEGSSAKASKAMEWITTFAAKTPYELAEVTDNFVKLRAYGIDPTNGTLKTLGDTAAAMGKPLSAAVEALADAMTGENERLKEFGITASKAGSKITYRWQQDGKTLTKTVNANNREVIRSTLAAIWNSRYGGAADKLSQTWAGMISGVKDRWTLFKSMVMESGAFDSLKQRLGALLDKFDAMAKSGDLRKLAEVVGKKLVHAIDMAWDAGQRLVNNWDSIKANALRMIAPLAWLVKNCGALTTVVGAVATMAALVLVPAIYSTATAFYALGVAILTTPVGWILAAIAAIAAAAYLIYRNWGPITAFFGTWWQSVKDIFGAVGDFFADVWNDVKAGFEDGFLNGIINLWIKLNPVNLIVRAFRELLPRIMAAVAPLRDKMRGVFGAMVPDWAERLIGGKSSVNVTGAAGLGAQAMGERAAAAQQGQFRVGVDFSRLPIGARVQTQSTGRNVFELNQGYAFGAG